MRDALTRTAMRRAALLASRQQHRRLASVSPLSDQASSSSSSSWKPPIAPGVEPAYDEALKFISEQAASMRQRIPALRTEAEQLQRGTAEREQAEARVRSYEVASEINDPEIRWRFQNDQTIPLSSPVFAHLREQAWRRQVLRRIIERIQLMKVLPDVIPSISPTVDLQVAFGQGEGIHDHGGEGGDVLTGCFVSADKTLQPPQLTATPFHADERLYTLALVDADTPYEDSDRLGSKALWLVHNIPLSLTRTEVDISAANEVLHYIAPHPPRGMKYHRYVAVLLAQPAGISVSAQEPSRDHFSVQDLAARHNLTPAGIHFWRAVWTAESKEAISSVYNDVLHVPEPHYERMAQH